MSQAIKVPGRFSAEKSQLLSLVLKQSGLKRQETITRRDRSEPLPLSFAQQRLWFLHKLDPANPQYNTPVGARLSGDLDVGVLEQTLREIVRRHEALRTVFPAIDGQPAQVVLPSLDFDLPVTDLMKYPLSERQARAQEILDREASRPFDLEVGPMVRFSLLRLAEAEHWLLLLTHHMVFDSWSIGIFGRELQAIYSAFAERRPSPLPEPTIQYGDFAAWQRERLQGKALEEQLAYWTKNLAGAPPLLTLPTDRPRPPVQTFRGRVQTFSLPKHLAESLTNLSRKQGATLFMTLMTAFQTLLYRYTGQQDIVVGTAVANRNRKEIEDLIGCFVNTLLFRTSFDGDPTFSDALRKVHQLSLEVFAHQDVPFEKLVSTLHTKRDLSYSPLTQVMLVFHNTDRPRSGTRGLSISQLDVPEKMAAQFDLLLHLRHTWTGLHGTLEYNTDLFDTTTADRILGHFRAILESIVENPEQRVSVLNILTGTERNKILLEFNDTRTDFRNSRCVHNLFEEQAERTPDEVAIIFQHEILTYSQLNHNANRLAHHLRSLGVGLESRVGLLVERSTQMVVALLAILKAGGAYVPLDPSYPSDRIEFMIEDSDPPVLITQQRFAERLDASHRAVVCLDSDWQAMAQNGEMNPQPLAAPSNIAYVLYTSGSTGMPKGVAVTQGALENFLRSMSSAPGLTRGDILAAITTLSFDIAGLELYLPLIVGARLLLVSRETAIDAQALRRVLTESGANAMQATPSTWRMLLDAGWQSPRSFKLLCGGEGLPSGLAQQLVATGASVWNLYGPTETTIWSTLKRLEAGDPVTIGRPIANTRVYVLDGALQPVPIGVPGEVYIGGRGVARGYLNRPDLTADRFIPDPFGSEPGSRLYRTGDLARLMPNGDIDCLGRVDRQVKMRGFRVELAEIEAALARHPLVRQTVVTAREDVAGQKRLVAYVIAEAEESVGQTTDDAVSSMSGVKLREFLQKSLPNHMIPSAFVFLDRFPQTPNGKIDVKALPAPETTRPDVGIANALPRTPTERQLADIWSELLAVERIGLRDDFFELGGDSLLIQRLLAKIEERFQIILPVRAVFLAPTLEHLASAIERATKTGVSEEQRLQNLVDSLSDEQIDSLLGEALLLAEI